MRKSKVLLLGCAIIFAAYSHASAQVQWALDTVIAVGTNPSGIAITSDGSRLVITNDTNPGKIEVVSTADYSVSAIDVSSIENYPNAVAVSPGDSTAVVTTTHKVIFIDLRDDSVKGQFTAPCAGTTLYGVAVTPDGQSVIFPDLSSGCTVQGLRFIGAGGTVGGSTFVPVSTSGELYGIAISPDSTSALVTTYTSDSPKIINLAAATVQNISGMSGSYGIAALHKSNEALIFDGDSLDLVSLTANSVIKKISGLSYNTSFQNIAVTSDDKYAFAIGAFEKLVISLDADSVIQTFTAGGTNVAASPDGSRFYVTDSYSGTVRVYKETGATGVEATEASIPSYFQLLQNYPNPFNPTTAITYDIAKPSHVTLTVYDILGRQVVTLVNAAKSPGHYQVTFDGARLPSGVYFYRLQAGNYSATKKLMLVK